ncbi:MAG: hypothetical protein L6R38_005716 [Xanthoria sp. 2 TBL-2021]|nr:MAG: hypothetical protein L6R38_005716 [Xanthoria sp. 2 TBL-2021]
MKSLSIPSSTPCLYLLTFLLLIFPLALSKPVSSPPYNTHRPNALKLRDPNVLDLNPYASNLHVRNTGPSSHTLIKRDRTTLPGGWIMIIESEQAFSNVQSAARTLVNFYESMIESTSSPQYAGLRAQLLQMGIPNGPFELVFRLRDQYNHPNSFVPIALAKYVCRMFLLRAQRGSAVRFQGWLEHPASGVVLDVVLNMAAGVAVNILDSAMDIHGS